MRVTIRTTSSGLAALTVLSLSAFGAAPGRADLSDGLVAYWNFDEGSGSVAHDSSGNGYDGTIYGGATWTTGVSGSALDFDGQDDYVSVPVSAPTTVTLTAWLNPRIDGSAIRMIFDKENEFYFEYRDGRLYQYTYQNDWLFSNTILPVNAWSFVALVRTPTTVVFYLNGQNDGGGATSPRDFGGTYCIGSRFGVQYQYDGIIDEVRIYNRALSADEIHELYESTAVLHEVAASQRQDASKLVDVDYALTGDVESYTITMQVSDDDGETWEVVPIVVSGDIGEGVVPGPGKHIVWNPVVDLPDVVGSNFKVRVIADGVYYANSNTFSIDNRGSTVQVEQRAEGIFLSDVPFQNTFKAVVNDWGGGSPGTVTFDLNGQSVTLPYVEGGVETDAFDMSDLPAGECAVNSTLLVTGKNSAGTVVGQTGVRLQCIDRPWFMPPNMYVKPLSPLQWGQEIVYELYPQITFMNLDATWYGENALFKNYGGLISGGELTIEFNGKKGEYTFGINADLNPTEDKPKLSKLLKPTTHKRKMSWKGEGTLGASFSATATISPASGCFEGGPEVCAGGQFGYEWKLIPIGPIILPCLWFTGKAGFDIGPELCFEPFDFSLDNPVPLTAVDVTFDLMGQGGLEFGIPYFLSVFGGLEGNAGGKIHILGDEVPTCWDWPLLADLNFDLAIVAYARLWFAEWELGRWVIIEWSCPQGKVLLFVPLDEAPAVMRKAGRPYLENREPYATFQPGIRSGRDVKRDASRGEADELITSNTNLEATPATAGWGNLTLVATSEDDPNTPEYVEHEIYVVFRDASVWGEKVGITDNSDADGQPTAAFDIAGVPLVAWVTLPGTTGEETLEQMKAKMEIAYSIYDDGTDTWSPPVQLTSNSSLDGLPQLVRGADGSLNLVWLHSEDNSLSIGPGEPLGTPPTVLAARWNGAEFGASEVLLPTCDTGSAIRYARDAGGREYLLWTWEADGDLSTVADREVVESHTVGGVWTTPAALTSNSVADTAVGLLATSGGVVAYYARAGGTQQQPQDLLVGRVFDGSAWSNEEVLISAPTSILSPSFSLGADGNVSCAWIGPTFNGDGKVVLYASSPNGIDNWSTPQEMAVSSLPTAPACTHAGSNVQVCYVSARPARGADKIEFGLRGARSTAFDVRLLDHTPYTDLWITDADIAIGPQPPVGGEPATVSVTVHLSGDYDQAGVAVSVFDGDPNQGGVLIGSAAADLIPGGQVIVELPWTYPSDFSEHEIYAVLDPNNVIAESDENNNVAHVAIGQLNLQAVSVHPVFWTAQHVGVRVTVSNTGYATLTNVAFELRRDSETGPLILSATVASVPAAERVEMVVPWDITLTDPGVYELFLLVDPFGAVQEQEESDNIISGLIRVLPDLQAEQWSAAIVGTTAQITVRNVGAKPMPATIVRVIRAGQTLGEASLAALDAGASADVTIPLAAPVPSGAVTIRANPDSTGTDEVTLLNNGALVVVPPLRGDLNCDGTVDFGDINPFVLYLSNYSVWLQTYADCPPENGDINGDGSYPSFGDINPFVALLTGG